MKQRKPTKTWERTRLQNLVRHKSGRYYARAYACSKEFWKSLRTSHFSVAQARLAEFLKDHRERHQGAADGGSASAKMKFREAAEIHLQNLNDGKSKTQRGIIGASALAALVKSWPALAEKLKSLNISTKQAQHTLAV